MRHCVEDYEPACREGESVILSIRRCGKRLATVAIGRNFDGWEIQHIAGFANRVADKKVRVAAQALIQLVSAPLSHTAHQL